LRSCVTIAVIITGVGIFFGFILRKTISASVFFFGETVSTSVFLSVFNYSLGKADIFILLEFIFHIKRIFVGGGLSKSISTSVLRSLFS
jgi:hypothetical protein